MHLVRKAIDHAHLMRGHLCITPSMLIHVFSIAEEDRRGGAMEIEIREMSIYIMHVLLPTNCSHGIKRCLLLGKKATTNLDSILKSRDFANKGPSSQD